MNEAPTHTQPLSRGCETGTFSAGPLVDATDAAFGYGSRTVVSADRLTLRQGECVGIFGHNGSGKTTLVRGLLGLLKPLGGTVVGPGNQVRSAFLSQYRGIDQAWPMTGFDVAALSVSARQRFGWLTPSLRKRIRDSIDRMGVSDLVHRPFATLSGGQQQRLLLAGVIADQPDLLVLDEPTDGLDTSSRDRLLRTLDQLKAEGICIVMISHDVDDLLNCCDAVAWLRPGSTPLDPSTARLVSPSELADRLMGVRP